MRELPKAQPMGEPVNCTSSELSIYLLALEEGYLATSCLDTNPSAPLKSNPIASKSYTQGNKTVSFLGFPSLQMSKSLTENLGEEKLTLSAEGSLAKTLVNATAQVESDLESKEKKAVYGESFQESLAKYDPAECLWRTPQCLLFEDLGLSLEIWPQWGMTLNGECFTLPSKVCVIDENDCSLLPTPTASDAFRLRYSAQAFQNIYQRRKLTKIQGDGTLGTVLPTFHQKRTSPESVEMMMNWPLGWTELTPLETGKFQQWLNSHGKL